MNIVTVAEGVDNDNQLVQLRSLGCDIAQGYLFSRAISAERVPAWIRKWTTNLPGWAQFVTERVAVDPPIRSACPDERPASPLARSAHKQAEFYSFLTKPNQPPYR